MEIKLKGTVKFTLTGEAERNIETIKQRFLYLEKNIPYYLRIEEDVMESTLVFKANAELFKEEVEELKSKTALLKKEVNTLRRTKEEFKQIAIELREIKAISKYCYNRLRWNVSTFFTSSFYELYFGEGGFYRGSDKMISAPVFGKTGKIKNQLQVIK